MTIALVGSGEYLPPMQPVDRGLINRLGEPARVVCLPTAAGKEGAERIDYWSRLGVEHFTRLGAQVESLPVIDRQSAGDTHLAERVARANFVYLSGGSPRLPVQLPGRYAGLGSYPVGAGGRRHAGRLQRRGDGAGRQILRLPSLDQWLQPAARYYGHPAL